MSRPNKTLSDSGEVIQSGKWNASRDWTQEMVFRPLYNCYVFHETGAKFGTYDPGEGMWKSENEKIAFRINSMEWLVNELIEAINNSEFALNDTKSKNKEKKSDKEKSLEYLKRLEYIQDNLLKYIQENQQRGSKKIIKINEEKFKILLRELQKIRRNLQEFVNNSELIYFQKEADLTKDEMDEYIWKEMTET